MYLHKVFLDKEALIKNRKKYYDIYQLHQTIWAIASKPGEKAKRDFLYHVEYDAYGNIKFIYLLAKTPVAAIKGTRIVVSPKLQPQLSKGDRLHFKLRANPIVKRKDKRTGRHKEHSLIVDAKHQYKKQNHNYTDNFSFDELIYEVGINWLARKAKQHGFKPIGSERFEIKIDNFFEFKVSPHGSNDFILRTLDFEGVLEVEYPKCFQNALYTGIGPGKAFGCGLILVRRI